MSNNSNSEEPRADANGTALEYISATWPLLPPHVHEAILTLVDAAVLVQISDGHEESDAAAKPIASACNPAKAIH